VRFIKRQNTIAISVNFVKTKEEFVAENNEIPHKKIKARYNLKI